jgi:hypothetical protein
MNRKSAPAARGAQARSQISAMFAPRSRRPCPAAGLVAAVLFGAACSSNLGSSPDGATSSCADVTRAYSDAVLKAQECTVGAAGQCSVQVRASFWCNCMTWVNGDAATLAAIANQYQALGCQSVCNGICAQPQSLECLADATSATGGRCKPPALLSLGVADDGGSFSVPVGYEIDILLPNIGPNGYEMQAVLSSDAATVIEVTIPAGPITPAGAPYLYRIKALSAGQVVVQIPHLELPDASQPAYTITLNIS